MVTFLRDIGKLVKAQFFGPRTILAASLLPIGAALRGVRVVRGVGALAPVGRALAGAGRFTVAKPLRAAGLFIGIPFGASLIAQSPKTRSVVGEIIDPRKSIERGKKAAEIIEKKRKVPKGVVAGLKTAGIVGGVAALAAGAVIATKKIKGIIPTIPKIKKKDKAPIPLSPAPADPLGTVKEVKAPKDIPIAPQAPSIINTIQIQNIMR